MTPTSWHQLHTWHFADHESSVMMMAACVCACRDEDDKLWSRPPSIFVHTHSTASRLHGDCPVPGAPFRKFGTFNPLLTVNKKKMKGEGWFGCLHGNYSQIINHFILSATNQDENNNLHTHTQTQTHVRRKVVTTRPVCGWSPRKGALWPEATDASMPARWRW